MPAGSGASTRPTRRRSTSPTASARTRPFGLRSATSRATRMPSSTAGGISALASRRAAPCSKRASSSSSSRTRMCSVVAPDGPAAEPRRARRRLSRKACWGGGMLDQARAGARLAARARKAPAVAAAGREARQGCQDRLWLAVLLSRLVRRRTARQGGQGLGAPARPRQRGLAESSTLWQQRRQPPATGQPTDLCGRSRSAVPTLQ